MSNKNLETVANKFSLEGDVISIKPLGEGFINDTYTIFTKEGQPNYLLQRKNHSIFPDVPGMMDNIQRVTEHIKRRVVAEGGDPLREALTVTPTKDGQLYYKDEDGDFWAACLFIEGSVAYDRADSPKLAYMGGKGIGKFQFQLSDFSEPLSETIKGFHNIRWRFKQWDETVKEDRAGRVKELSKEIGWVESRREEMLNFWEKYESGEIPTRVTHNDTKISNILFDNNNDILCVIDLDTVMSSTALNDFGDAIRSYANTGAEDDKNLDSVSMNIEMFKAYAEGYLSQMKDVLTDIEKDYLAFSAKYITFEQVLRFLMDYIDGDRYYRTHYPEHNLVRTKAQYKLLTSIEDQYDAMRKIISEIK